MGIFKWLFGWLFGGNNAASGPYEGTEGPDTYSAGSGNNVIYGNGGNDTLKGGKGDDTIDGGAGDDNLIGGKGNDTYIFKGTDFGKDTVEDSGGKRDTLVFEDGITLEDLSGQGSGMSDYLIKISGSNSSVLLKNQIKRGNDGVEFVTINGVNMTWDDFTAALNSRDDIDADAMQAALTAEETEEANEEAKLLPLSPLDFKLKGNDQYDGKDDVIASKFICTDTPGKENINWIDAGGGNDTVFSNGGPDRITGGNGDDIIYGGPGDDVIGGDDRPDIVDIHYVGNDSLYGGAGNDSIGGHAGDDQIDGGTGNDTLGGGSGNDLYLYTLYDGRDVIADGIGTDTLELRGINANQIGVKSGKVTYEVTNEDKTTEVRTYDGVVLIIDTNGDGVFDDQTDDYIAIANDAAGGRGIDYIQFGDAAAQNFADFVNSHLV